MSTNNFNNFYPYNNFDFNNKNNNSINNSNDNLNDNLHCNNCSFNDNLLNRSDSNRSKKSNSDFNIFGINFSFDDLLIIGLLFFLYKEEVNDTSLYIALILLLLG